ncbi:hypothetical protein [Legionella drancourtii]|uniref:Uncharacterized protein n=1 Tax=Legionella drancourtii LLAP12 TaxID=658187 RepID=G9EUF2_9GAMM|nr:hypothetical protein [Legionella drancourtii]EHL28952.1 hypothetical protein LDG_8946 [Legionella drancourtii LLAP12]
MPTIPHNTNAPSTHLLPKIRTTKNTLNRIAPYPSNVVDVASSSPQLSMPKIKHNVSRPRKITKPFAPVLEPITEELHEAPSSSIAINSPRTSPSSSSSTTHKQILDAVEKIYLSALLACDFLRTQDYEHYIKYQNIIEPYLITQYNFSRKISVMMSKLEDKHHNYLSCCSFFLKRTKQDATLTDQIINAFLKIDYLINEDAEEFGTAITAAIKTKEPAFNLDKSLLKRKELINDASAELESLLSL